MALKTINLLDNKVLKKQSKTRGVLGNNSVLAVTTSVMNPHYDDTTESNITSVPLYLSSKVYKQKVKALKHVLNNYGFDSLGVTSLVKFTEVAKEGSKAVKYLVEGDFKGSKVTVSVDAKGLEELTQAHQTLHEYNRNYLVLGLDKYSLVSTDLLALSLNEYTKDGLILDLRMSSTHKGIRNLGVYKTIDTWLYHVSKHYGGYTPKKAYNEYKEQHVYVFPKAARDYLVELLVNTEAFTTIMLRDGKPKLEHNQYFDVAIDLVDIATGDYLCRSIITERDETKLITETLDQ